MSFALASLIVAGVGTAASIGMGVNKNIQGRKKERQGKWDAFQAQVKEQEANLINDVNQQTQQAQMEGLAGQRMEEIANLQAKYNERAQEGLPDVVRDQYLEGVQSSQAQSLASNRSRRGGLVGAAGIDQSAVGAYKELLSMDANQRLANEQAALGFEGQAIAQKDALANRGLNYQIGYNQQNYMRDLSNAYADEDYAMALQGAGERMRYSGTETAINGVNQAGSFILSGGLAPLGTALDQRANKKAMSGMPSMEPKSMTSLQMPPSAPMGVSPSSTLTQPYGGVPSINNAPQLNLGGGYNPIWGG